MNTKLHIGIKQSFFAAFLITFLIIIGVVGYMLIEEFTFIEALYMTIITVSTVGFEEVHNLSDAGMIFTVILITFSIGAFGYTLTTITRYIIDGVFRNYYKDNKVKKRINKLNNHVIVCGYGRVGKQAVHELLEHGVEVVIIDNDMEEIELIRAKDDMLYIHGDATADEIMESAQIGNAQALITTLPKDADNLFVVLSAKELNKKLKIISRASDEHSDKKLKRAGASNVIMPDRIGGQRMAKLVAQPDIVEFIENILIQNSSEVNLVEISCNILHESLLNKTIGSLGIRNKSGANIIGLKDQAQTYIFNPPADQKIKPTDKLFVLGNPLQINAFKNILKSGI
ncbi:MAG: potassium channel protein [Bacteroidales bacterium]|nr:potassium channel protein [Bacteroidales bacterium]